MSDSERAPVGKEAEHDAPAGAGADDASSSKHGDDAASRASDVDGEGKDDRASEDGRSEEDPEEAARRRKREEWMAKPAIERVLDRDEKDRVRELEQQLQTRLDSKVKLWVKDPVEGYSFSLDVSYETTGLEIKEMIQDIDGRAGRYKVLHLIYRGALLADDRPLKAYDVDRERRRWSSPYGGVIWIAPQHMNIGFLKRRRAGAKGFV
eukprot:PLAT5695.1.p1 GENE.PLAT5695.1~~PLAT5695.1.p1  ORF type:complete len:219 (-),score=63.72 PLAT5695.1:118-741(-)